MKRKDICDVAIYALNLPNVRARTARFCVILSGQTHFLWKQTGHMPDANFCVISGRTVPRLVKPAFPKVSRTYLRNALGFLIAPLMNFLTIYASSLLSCGVFFGGCVNQSKNLAASRLCLIGLTSREIMIFCPVGASSISVSVILFPSEEDSQ